MGRDGVGGHSMTSCSGTEALWCGQLSVRGLNGEGSCRCVMVIRNGVRARTPGTMLAIQVRSWHWGVGQGSGMLQMAMKKNGGGGGGGAGGDDACRGKRWRCAGRMVEGA